MKMFRMKSVIAGIAIFLLPLIVSAQSFILQDPPTEKPKFTFRYFRPHFKESESSLSFLSGVYDFTVSIPLSAKVNIIGSVPFSAVGWKDFDESESSFGNISAGIQYRFNSTDEKATAVTFGVFAPTASEEKESLFMMGFLTNYYEIPKYFPNVLTIYGNLSHHVFKADGLLLNLELGPYFMIPTEGGDPELFIHYGLSGGYRVNPISFNVELAGIGILSEESEDFGDRFEHMLAFGAQWNRGWIRPGIYYQLYLKKEMREYINGVLGIKLEIDLKK